ncbi:MAG TPA: tryptophan synthase subunit alpha [Clostridia bacterium]|nr:tryptophan synthase subunit alpha [Clostridia bacterium]
MAMEFANRPGLVVYLTCGDPSVKATRDIALAAIGAGADIIELGVPFSDPVADGPVIQRASERAITKKTTLADVLQIAREIRERSRAGLIVFSYMNPIMRYGVERFCRDAREAGVDGALVTDLPIEEAGDYIRHMRAQSLATVFLASPTSPDDRLHSIANASTGFVYAVSRTGVTGTQKELTGDAEGLVARLRKFTGLPIAVGFGISTAEQFTSVGRFADAAVVGSAIVQTIERNPDEPAEAVASFVHRLVSSRRRWGATPAGASAL